MLDFSYTALDQLLQLYPLLKYKMWSVYYNILLITRQLTKIHSIIPRLAVHQSAHGQIRSHAHTPDSEFMIRKQNAMKPDLKD